MEAWQYLRLGLLIFKLYGVPILAAVAFFVLLPVFLFRKLKTAQHPQAQTAFIIALVVWGLLAACCLGLLVMLLGALFRGMGEGIHEMNTT